ncbi:hypothetical protein CLV84_0786 [Neolewinella xylanilytica]|uniref:Histidine kinase n=1 Tax=Neolewinella xylanilytica TaxID=1514080 RepID=A0A2S6I8L8_9BACT|nr:FIST N-terminal domain-containing protein [Neolewinella xylanilytica]PPK87833.1 hypothetical protein CLV84_0786 [Neolewinella xylanilytica]
MKHQQYIVRTPQELPASPDPSVDLVLGFGNKALLECGSIYSRLQALYQNATVGLCSTAGEIYGGEVSDRSLSVLTLSFAHTRVRHRGVLTEAFADSFAAGQALVTDLEADDLQLIILLSDGALVNGSELVKGIQSVIPDRIPITGGLAGDGADFQYTLVGLNEEPRRGRIVAIGLYGNRLKVAHGSCGGWQPFGVQRVVTKSSGNELFEIDGKNALAIYKRYLGNHAADLPGSALHFPLSMEQEDGGYLVRSILKIDEERQSMIFAGDLPEGSRVRFMMANLDRLTEAASTAARLALATEKAITPQVAILISCLGRRVVLGDRVDEEVEAVREVFGPDTVLTGYYSYGEISPLLNGGPCALHNQTMTITCLEELP